MDTQKQQEWPPKVTITPGYESTVINYSFSSQEIENQCNCCCAEVKVPGMCKSCKKAHCDGIAACKADYEIQKEINA